MIIVGAGLAGLSLALGLTQQHGDDGESAFRVHLVEKQFNFNRTGATFGLQPNGKKALNEIAPGVVDELEKIGLFIPQVRTRKKRRTNPSLHCISFRIIISLTTFSNLNH